MSTNIQLLRSGIAYKRPAAAPLLDGQAAINYNDAEPGLFWRLSNGQLAKAGPVALTDNGMEPNAAPAGETGNSVGEEWLDSHPALHSPILHVFNGTEFVTANGFTVDKSTGDLTLLRTLEVTHLIAGSAQINGDLVVGGNITPNGQNCAFYLGLPNERWDYLYACNFNITYDGTIGRDLFVDRDVTVLRDLTVGNYVKSNLTPDLDATRFLGQPDHRWVLYANDAWINGNAEIGLSNAVCGSTTLTVHSTTTFKCPVTFENAINFDTIGTGCTDTLTINATTTFKCPVTFENTVNLGDGGLNAGGTIILGDGCNTSTINLNGAVTLSCDMLPDTTSVRKIGSPSKRLAEIHAADVYTGDLHMKNGRGDFTLIEETEYITIRNNKTGKTYRLLMEEV